MKYNKCFIVLLVLLLSNAGKGYAQFLGGGADDNVLSFGFSFQVLQQSYKIAKRAAWQDNLINYGAGRSLIPTSIGSKPTTGFAVGFITRYQLLRYLEVRTTPSLVFADRQLDYTFTDSTENTSRQVQSTMVDVPLLFKLQSEKVGNIRAYLLGGVKYSVSVTKNKEDLNQAALQRKILNNRGFASYEAGMGLDIYFKYFKMSPELKVSNSFGNILVQSSNPLTAPIGQLFLHSVMFSLHFE